MSNRKPLHEPKPIPIGRSEFGLAKLGAQRFDLRDPYHLAVSVSWPVFVAMMLALWLTINLLFASLYALSPGDVANTSSGSFSDVFFFSVETLATVGYGVMAPASLYAHIISSVEIFTGTALTAIVTGLLFVRFSRPKPRIIAAEDVCVTVHNGRPTLMLRIVNGRVTVMSSANVRLFVLMAERVQGPFVRRIHELRVEQNHLPLFVMPWTVVHVIDENSPLRGYDSKALADAGVRLFLTIEARDHALSALVYDMKYYDNEHIRFGKRFADMVTQDETGGSIADLSRISLLEIDDGEVIIDTDIVRGQRA